MYGAYNDEYDEMMTDHMQKSNSQRGGAGRVGHSLWIQRVSALAPPDQSTQLTHSPHLTLLPVGPVGQVWWALLMLPPCCRNGFSGKPLSAAGNVAAAQRTLAQTEHKGWSWTRCRPRRHLMQTSMRRCILQQPPWVLRYLPAFNLQ